MFWSPEFFDSGENLRFCFVSSHRRVAHSVQFAAAHGGDDGGDDCELMRVCREVRRRGRCLGGGLMASIAGEASWCWSRPCRLS